MRLSWPERGSELQEGPGVEKRRHAALREVRQRLGRRRPERLLRPIVVIPARMGSTRLPGKPLAQIAGKPMIVHVLERALEAAIGPVAVAADSPEIARVVEAAGGVAIVTRREHACGTDRIGEALDALDPGGAHDVVVNLQGDQPAISPHAIRAALALLEDERGDQCVDVATLAALAEPGERDNPNVVKLVGASLAPRRLRALYFTRASAPYGDGPHYRHIGLYAFRRDSFTRFVSLPPSTLERRERLEQLRALEHGMRIDALLLDKAPQGVDTNDDLERLRDRHETETGRE
ncbi:MAG: 3-deoxy-manno-octulosonate cytidylyltransferase [Methylocystis sp.]|nr:3-deoxy-manno-octulosonate cytidylyltransferase [Methylocystis sp.]